MKERNYWIATTILRISTIGNEAYILHVKELIAK